MQENDGMETTQPATVPTLVQVVFNTDIDVYPLGVLDGYNVTRQGEPVTFYITAQGIRKWLPSDCVTVVPVVVP